MKPLNEDYLDMPGISRYKAAMITFVNRVSQQLRDGAEPIIVCGPK